MYLLLGGSTVLGSHNSTNGIVFDPAKRKAVLEWSMPNNVPKVRSFMGLVGYYQKFFVNFSKKYFLITSL